MARITIVTDAWCPQVNGVVTTLSNTVRQAQAFGHVVDVIDSRQFPTLPCPTYPEIRFARTTRARLREIIANSRPDYVLVGTEGPLGLIARNALIEMEMPFSTAFLTNFHDYLWHRFGLPKAVTLRGLDWFHRPAHAIFTPTVAMQHMLAARGLQQARVWSVGVDTETFCSRHGPSSQMLAALPKPVLLYVGRIAIEKNLEAFLKLDVPGSKVVVGDGPYLANLRRRFPRAHYLGRRQPIEIAELCSASDVMVFPSRTDTFGHVIVEALACGLPVAAYPVRGPLDILTDPAVGAMNEDLAIAVQQALACNREACAAFVQKKYCWESSFNALLENLPPTDRPHHAASGQVA